MSKLVACCIPSDAEGDRSPDRFSHVLALLKKLLLQTECSLHDYVKVSLATFFRNLFSDECDHKDDQVFMMISLGVALYVGISFQYACLFSNELNQCFAGVGAIARDRYI